MREQDEALHRILELYAPGIQAMVRDELQRLLKRLKIVRRIDRTQFGDSIYWAIEADE